MNRLHAFLQFIDRISVTVGWAASLIVVPQVLALTYEVFARYIFNSPTIWSFDATYMMYGTHYLLGAAYTLKVKGHIRIDVIYGQLKPRKQAVIDVICYLLIFFPILTALIIGGFEYVLRAYTVQEVSQFTPWQPKLWPFKGLIFIGFCLLSLQSLAEFIRSLHLALKGKPL